jgi:hypothetical protein
VNYPNNILLSNLRDTRRFKDDNKKVGVEEQKLLSNPATKFSEFVNADENTKTMATTNIDELCQPCEKWQWYRRPPFPEFGEDVSSFAVLRRYLCSYNNDNTSLSRLEHLERGLFLIHLTNKQK